MLDFRHELKYQINMLDYHTIKNRLCALMAIDPNSDTDGRYLIRSLYFDNANDKALWEKLDGLNEREKFRIRYYNGDKTYIRLEKKSKLNGLGNKQSAILSYEDSLAIIQCNWKVLQQSKQPLVLELYSKMQSQLLRPKTIVQYVREAYVYPPGNVRITFDSELKTGLFSTNLFDMDTPMVTPLEPVVLMEVKYDNFLPDIITRLIRTGHRRAAAFSKYAACRTYH